MGGKYESNIYQIGIHILTITPESRPGPRVQRLDNLVIGTCPARPDLAPIAYSSDG